MRSENTVLVKYHNPERNASESRPGWLLDAPQHIILIQGMVEGIDQYTYTVIPKNFIVKITQLETE